MENSAIFLTGLLAFGAAFLAGRYLGQRRTGEQRRATARLRELNAEPNAEHATPNESIRTVKEALLALGLWLSPKATADAPGAKNAADLRTRLDLAGFRQQAAPIAFSVIQFGLVIALALLAGGIAAMVGGSWRKMLLLGASGAGLGLLLPSMVLSSRAARRKRKLQNAFPDALDILVLSIEGGASMNAAIAWVNDEIPAIHPLLSEEWSLVQREVQMGLPCSEAFLQFANRTGLEEARDLSAALLNAERYGASLAKALRAFADNSRQDRAVWAEEIAQKAAVKIIFPMLLCIFPAIFIVLLGPAATQMSRLFAR